jgi:hypothetical protein
MCVRYLDTHGFALCCYLVIHVEHIIVHYACFASIYDVFTESPL